MQSLFLYLFLFSLPFERLLTLEAAGFTLKVSYVFGLLLAILSLKNKSFFSLKNLRVEDWSIIFFVLFALLTSLWSLDPRRTLFLGMLSTFSIVICLLFKRLRYDHKKVIEILIWTGIATSLFGLWQFFGDAYGLNLHFTFLRTEYVKGVFPFPRIQSTFLEPLFFANFLLLPIYLSIGRYLQSKDRKYLIILFLLSLAFFLTLSRGALYGLTGSAVISFFVVFHYSRRSLLLFVQALVFLLLSFFFSLFLIFVTSQKSGLSGYLSQAGKTTDQNIVVSGNQELTQRAYTQKIALKASKSHLLGIGFGTFGNLPEFAPILQTGNHQTVNNQYLEILVETGIIGFLLFITFWLMTLFGVFAFARHEVLGISFLGLLIAWLIQYLSFSAFNLIYLWVTLGFISNYCRKRA